MDEGQRVRIVEIAFLVAAPGDDTAGEVGRQLGGVGGERGLLRTCTGRAGMPSRAIGGGWAGAGVAAATDGGCREEDTERRSEPASKEDEHPRPPPAWSCRARSRPRLGSGRRRGDG